MNSLFKFNDITFDFESLGTLISQKIKLVTGFTLTEDLSEQFDSASLIVLSSSLTPFSVGRPIFIVFPSGYENLNNQFIINTDKVSVVKLNEQGTPVLFKHTLTLVEPTALLVNMQASALSFPLLSNKKWTIREAIARLIRLNPYKIKEYYTIDVSGKAQTINEWVNYNFEIDDNSLTGITNMELPEFTLTNTSLFNQLNSILSMITPSAYIIRLDVAKIANSALGRRDYKFILKAVKLDDLEAGYVTFNSKTIFGIDTNKSLNTAYNGVSTWVQNSINNNPMYSSGTGKIPNSVRSKDLIANNSDLRFVTTFPIAEIMNMYVLVPFNYSNYSFSNNLYQIQTKDNITYILNPVSYAKGVYYVDLFNYFVTDKKYSTFSREDKEKYYFYTLGENYIDFKTLSDTENPMFTITKFKNILLNAMADKLLNIYRAVENSSVSFVDEANDKVAILNHYQNTNYISLFRNQDFILSILNGWTKSGDSSSTNNDFFNFINSYMVEYNIYYKPYLRNILVKQENEETNINTFYQESNENQGTNIVDIEKLGEQNKAKLKQYNQAHLTLKRFYTKPEDIAILGQKFKDATLTNNQDYILTDFTLIVTSQGFNATENYAVNYNRLYRYSGYQKVYRDVLKPQTSVNRAINYISNNSINKNIVNDKAQAVAIVTFNNGSNNSRKKLIPMSCFQYGDYYCACFVMSKDNWLGDQLITSKINGVDRKVLNPIGLYEGNLEKENDIDIKIAWNGGYTKHQKIDRAYEIEEVAYLPDLEKVNENKVTSPLGTSTYAGGYYPSLNNDYYNKIYHLTRERTIKLPQNVTMTINGQKQTNTLQNYVILPAGYYKLGLMQGSGDSAFGSLRYNYPNYNATAETVSSSEFKRYFIWDLMALEGEENSLIIDGINTQAQKRFNFLVEKQGSVLSDMRWGDADFDYNIYQEYYSNRASQLPIYDATIMNSPYFTIKNTDMYYDIESELFYNDSEAYKNTSYNIILDLTENEIITITMQFKIQQ